MNDIRRRHFNQTDQDAFAPAYSQIEAGDFGETDRDVEDTSRTNQVNVQPSASAHNAIRWNFADQPLQSDCAAGDNRPLAHQKPGTRAEQKPLRFDSFSALSRHLSET